MWPVLQVLIEYFSDRASINLSSHFIFLAILHVACPPLPFPPQTACWKHFQEIDSASIVESDFLLINIHVSLADEPLSFWWRKQRASQAWYLIGMLAHAKLSDCIQ